MTKQKTKENARENEEIIALALLIVKNKEYIAYESENLISLFTENGITSASEDAERGWYALVRYEGVASREIAHALARHKSNTLVNSRAKFTRPEVLVHPQKHLDYSESKIFAVLKNEKKVREVYVALVTEYVEQKLPHLIKQTDVSRSSSDLSNLSTDKSLVGRL